MLFLILLLPVFVLAWSAPEGKGWKAAVISNPVTEKVCDEKFIDDNMSKPSDNSKIYEGDDFPSFTIRTTRGSYDFPFGLKPKGDPNPEAFNIRLFAYFYPQQAGTYSFSIEADDMAKIWTSPAVYAKPDSCYPKRDQLDDGLETRLDAKAPWNGPSRVFTAVKNSNCYNASPFEVKVASDYHYIPFQIFYVNKKMTQSADYINSAKFNLKITDASGKDMTGSLYYGLRQC